MVKCWLRLMFPNRLGLQGRITIIIAVTVVFVAGVSTLIAMWLTRDAVAEEIYLKALALARSTAHQLVNRGATQNPEELLRALRQIERDLPGVKQSDFYLHRGPAHLLTTTKPQGEHLELDNLPDVENYFEFERIDEDQISIETPDGRFWIIGTTIRDQGQPVACLNLEVSKSRLNIVTWDLVLRNSVVMLASLAVVILVIHLFLLRAVRRPVLEMIRVMEAAEGGQLNVRAEAVSEDEIGQLAKHLNRMLARIENFHTELGRKVEEATVELARRNEELARINQELFETQRTLARSERLAVAGQLAASLAHEIGTPLNSISGHVQLLGRRSAGDEATSRRLQIIEKQIDQIVRTVKQLLSWTHTLELHVEPVDIRHVLEESLLLSSPALRLRKIRVKSEMSPACPKIYGDAGYLQQVFLNLINNSMDAMPGGGELRVRLRPPDGSDGAKIAVELEDTGQGMTAETLAHIFEPMFTTKRMGTGSGLGLAICDQVIRRHAGSIHAESAPGRGTQFRITLPVDFREKVEAAEGPVSALKSAT